MTTPDQVVCIVDDDASVRKSLARLFRSAGLPSETFGSATEYLARLPYNGDSCLVLDVQMPELNGLDLQSALIANARDEQVVFITGQGDIPMCARAMKAGAADFFAKPFDNNELLAAVQRALARSHELRHLRASREEAQKRIATLTPRELQVFEHVIAGKLNKVIAADLGTSLKTVKYQRGRVMDKMGVATVAELVRTAQYAGYNSPAGLETKVQ